MKLLTKDYIRKCAKGFLSGEDRASAEDFIKTVAQAHGLLASHVLRDCPWIREVYRETKLTRKRREAMARLFPNK